MTEVRPPTTADIQKSLQRLRSSDPAERLRGVEGLSGVTDDPLVMQLFDHLYRTDPDEKVRDAVWRVINRQGPSVPSACVGRSAPQARPPDSDAPISSTLPTARSSPGPCARHRLRPAGHRLLDMLFVLALIAAAFLWGWPPRHGTTGPAARGWRAGRSGDHRPQRSGRVQHGRAYTVAYRSPRRR